MYVGDISKANARRFPSRPALKDVRRDLTWREVDQRVVRLANALTGRYALERGDRVSVLAENRAEYLEASSATAKAGLIFAPLNHRLAVPEMAGILDDSEPRVLLYSRAFADHVEQLTDGRDVELVALDPDLPGVPYDELLEGGSPVESTIEIAAGDIRGICYTGGTTGLPKGVMLTHGGVMAFGANQQIGERLRPDDRHLVIFPLGLLAGQVMPAWYWYQGAATVLLPRFDPDEVLRTIQDERITTVLLAPTMINALINHPDVGRYDYSSLRHILYGSSPISLEVLVPAMEMFGCDFIQAYGQTESTAFVLLLPPEDHLPGLPEQLRRRRLASAGRETLNSWVAVMDDDDNLLAKGETGELVVRSDQVMKGYWKNPEATEQAIRGGWLHTGDVARLDDDGYFEIVDRKKDMIISGAYNVYPKEVENVLYEHPAVREVAVIGVPDPHWGEAVHAIVRLANPGTVSADELIEFCKSRIASYKKPKSFEFVAEFPLTAAGKIAKHELRSRYWQGETRSVH